MRVNLSAFQRMGYATGSYTSTGKPCYIYSVENRNSNGVVEESGKHNSAAALSSDSSIRTFWNDLYSCMDSESQTMVENTYSGKYLGYVLKHVGGGTYPIHIDGIMDIASVPTYQIAVYDKDVNNLMVRTNTTATKSSYRYVQEMVEDYLRYF